MTLSRSVQDFLTQHITSVVELEVLLLLQRSPDLDWTAQELADELRIDPAWVQTQLNDLLARKLLSQEAGPNARYRYAPASPEIDQTIRELAEANAQRRVSVISFIYSKPIDQIRVFADAFRIRKDDKDG